MVRIYNKTGVTKSVMSTVFAASAFTIFLCGQCGGGDENNANYGDTIKIEVEDLESGNPKETISVTSHDSSGKQVISHPSALTRNNLNPVSHHQSVNYSGSATDLSTITLVGEVTDDLNILTTINNADLNSGGWWSILNPGGQAFVTLAKSLHTVTSTTGNTNYLNKYDIEKHKIANIIAEVEGIETKPARSPEDKMRLVYLYNQIMQILGSNHYVKDNDPAFVSTKTATKLISKLNQDKIDQGKVSDDPKVALTLTNVAANYATELADLKIYLIGHASSANACVQNMIEMINGIQTNNPANLTKHTANAKQIYDDVKGINGLKTGGGAPAQDANRNYYVDTMKVVILTIPNAVYPEFCAHKLFAITPKRA